MVSIDKVEDFGVGGAVLVLVEGMEEGVVDLYVEYLSVEVALGVGRGTCRSRLNPWEIF